MKRKICYVTGTRADFGLMQNTLNSIHYSDHTSLSIIVTGMHLAEQYGKTIQDIEAAGLPVSACVEIEVDPPTGATMAFNIGKMLSQFVHTLSVIQPDIILLLGDRGEMLAGALAAIHLNIPIVHIHGGERSGTVDEPVRHAISKLSHFHFTATREARERLIRMGEYPANIFVTGAPGLDDLNSYKYTDREILLRDLKFDQNKHVALMVYHPVLQEADKAGADVTCILDTLVKQKIQVVVLKPNSDAGSSQIRQVLEAYASNPEVRIITHFPRHQFIAWMAAADLIIGNSSAGIIEAASFGTPVINIGTRQNLRERNANVNDVPVDKIAIEAAIKHAIKHGRFERTNVYGDGKTASRIVALLERLPLDASILMKTNAY